jgi:two-component system sensor histidine kinase EvgS
MNGYELTEPSANRNGAPAAPLYGAGLYGQCQPEEVQRCKQAGMNDCLFKP